MPSGPDGSNDTGPRLIGGAAAVVAFIVTLLAFVIETQLTQVICRHTIFVNADLFM